MYFKEQKFFVAGMSVSGESSARFCLNAARKFTFTTIW